MANKRKHYSKYTRKNFFIKLFSFIGWKIYDLWHFRKNNVFAEYGLTLYAGKQGAGKTVAMLEYLERMRAKYPDCLILTNFGYIHETRPMTLKKLALFVGSTSSVISTLGNNSTNQIDISVKNINIASNIIME